MKSNTEKGRHGESLAKNYLEKQCGYKILCENYRVKSGEIDLIALDNNYIVFVEVKYRKNKSMGYPSEAVGFSKQMKIRKTAMHYIMIKNIYETDMRFDVIEVLGDTITHIENAFQ